MLCGAEFYVFHAGNVGFCLAKHKKAASILDMMPAAFYLGFSELCQEGLFSYFYTFQSSRTGFRDFYFYKITNAMAATVKDYYFILFCTAE